LPLATAVRGWHGHAAAFASHLLAAGTLSLIQMSAGEGARHRRRQQRKHHRQNQRELTHSLHASLNSISERNDLAKPGSCRLRSSENRFPVLASDYRKMQQKFFREPPKFADVRRTLKTLKNKINALG
jgi:hypothetical protein